MHVLRRLVSGRQRGHGAVADDLVDEGVDAVRLPAVGEADGAAAAVGQEGHLREQSLLLFRVQHQVEEAPLDQGGGGVRA